MIGGKPPKICCMRDSALDKLSNLPNHIIDQILIHLPVRDAVGTSLLSSKRRFKWTTMPALVFDENCFSFTSQDQTINQEKSVSFVDDALFLHNDQISKFMFYQRYPITSTDLDRWILRLLRCPVEEFILRLRAVQRYKLYSCLFSFENLVHLHLCRCHLKLPSIFGGLKKLKILELLRVTLAQDVLETLICSCPILEGLTFYKVDGFTQLNIDAPNLLEIDYTGHFVDINFINTSNLAIVSLIRDRDGVGDQVGDDSTEQTTPLHYNNLLKFLSSLPRIRQLTIDGEFLMYLDNCELPVQLSNPCPDLDYLHLLLYVDVIEEYFAALWMLRSSPKIQELVISGYRYIARDYRFMEEDEDPDTFWVRRDENLSFNKLRTVSTNIVGIRAELEFIRFMLSASPVLEKMTINTSSLSEALKLQLARELLTFERASVKAQVVLVETPDV